MRLLFLLVAAGISLTMPTARGHAIAAARATLCHAAGPAQPGQDLVSDYRRETARERLKIRWDNYVKLSDEPLGVADALKEVKKRDARPVLFVRDCETCSAKEHAALEKALEDERVQLTSQWFRCVRVDKSVVASKHPLHSLFDAGNQPMPHLVIYSADGTIRVDAPNEKPSAKTVTGLMNRILAKDYSKPAEPAVDKLIEILGRFDMIDARCEEVTQKREKAKAAGKVGNLEKDLKALAEQKARVEQEEKVTRELGLRKPAVAVEVSDHDADAAEAVRGSGQKGTLLDRVRRDSQPAGDPPRTGNGGKGDGK